MADVMTAGELYDHLLPEYKRLLDEVLFAIRQGLAEVDLKVHTVVGRVKTRESYLEKVERASAGDATKEVRDVVGARIVGLFLSDLPRIRRVLERTFEVIEVDDKIESADLTSFGYMSVHFICRLRREHTGPRYAGLEGRLFEVQCRTIVMDAWANVSHHLAYKGNASVPDALLRDFNALSGLFYVADQHFELFYGSAITSRLDASENLARGVDKRSMPIDVDTMTAYLRATFPDRFRADAAAVSELVEEISLLDGLDSIQDLDDALTSVRKAALRYERRYPPGGRGRYADVGIVRAALAIQNEQYRKLRYPGESDHYAQFRHADGESGSRPGDAPKART